MYTKKLTCIDNIPSPIMTRLVKDFLYAGAWESKDFEVVEFKRIVKENLLQLQCGKCAYCELPLKTRNPEIDHIAPKGGVKRPKHIECMFLLKNLVYACHNCNSPECKGQKDTVISKNGSADYTMWTFSIVHPYIDDPLEYFEMPPVLDDVCGVIPIPKHDADAHHKKKARDTINMFKLNSEKCLELAKEKLAEKYASEIINIISAISQYRPD